MNARLSYTSITDDQREAWDAIVSECADCASQDGDEPCTAHDLGTMNDDGLDAMIREWRESA